MKLIRRPTIVQVLAGGGLLVALAGLGAQVGLGAFKAPSPPAPRIASGPLTPTTSARAVFAFETMPGLQAECSLDGGRYAACASPVSYRSLRRGAHEFRVRARDTAGTAGRAASRTWRVVAPSLRRPAHVGGVVARPIFTTVPLRPWRSLDATFAWLHALRTTSECSLDGSRWRSCRSPRTYRALRVGAHAFRVRARTQDGRRSRTNRFSWTISLAALPAAPRITSAPDAQTSATTAVFSFEVARWAGYECRLDVSGWQQCSDPAIYVGLGTGSHLFCVRTIGAGGARSAETCVRWSVHSPPQSDDTPGSGFTVSGSLPTLLWPGAGGPLPLTISNPLPFDLRVTSIVVTVLAGSTAAGCDGSTNLAVTQSNTAGGVVSLVVPALGSLTLPAQGATAPTVAMLDLPVDQGACRGATFSLSYAAMGTRA